MPIFLLYNVNGLCPWIPEREILYPWSFLTVVSSLFMSPSYHTWVYTMRWNDSGWRPVTRKINHVTELYGFKTGEPPGRGREEKEEGEGNWRLSSIRHQWFNQSCLWKGVTTKKLWIPKLSGLSCLINTSLCWEDVAPRALYLGPFQT